MTIGTANRTVTGPPQFFVPLRVDGMAHEYRSAVQLASLAAGVGYAAVESDPCTMTRTGRLVASDDADSSVLLSIQQSGPFQINQFDRSARAIAGEAILYEAETPFTLHCEKSTTCVSMQVPSATLGIRRNEMRELVARPIEASTPTLRVLRSFSSAVMETFETMSQPTRSIMARTATDLLGALLLSLREGSERFSQEHRALYVAMQLFIEDHLDDPGLSTSAIADRHHVSVRHVSAVFANVGSLPPAAYVRERRLDRATRVLAWRPVVPISEVARRCGFTDVTTFARAFKREYGISPGEWRRERA